MLATPCTDTYNLCSQSLNTTKYNEGPTGCCGTRSNLRIFHPTETKIHLRRHSRHVADEVDSKTMSKWARALRYVARYERPDRPLKTFMKEAGGVNACAELYAR